MVEGNLRIKDVQDQEAQVPVVRVRVVLVLVLDRVVRVLVKIGNVEEMDQGRETAEEVKIEARDQKLFFQVKLWVVDVRFWI